MSLKLNKWRVLSLLLANFILVTSCEKDCTENESNESNTANYLPSIDATNLKAGNRPMTMFTDDESSSKMYNNKDRWFRVNEPLQIIQKGRDSIQLSLYSPVALSDVKIFAKLPNYDKKFVLYHFTKIPAFHRSSHLIPLVKGKNDYLLENGKTVTIDKIDGFSSDAITFSVESTDPLFAKFKKIKSSHKVQFSDSYHKAELGKFLPMNPVLAKEAITMIINYSYALSHPLYYETFVNFDKFKQEQAGSKPVNGAINWHGNATDTNGKYDYFTKAEIEQIYWNYLDGRILSIAMVGGEAALGGGALASQWEGGYVAGHWRGDMSIWSHEYSHHIGFSHTSNFANSGEGGGQQEMLTSFYKYLIYLNDLPFTDPEILQTWTKKSYLRANYNKPTFKIDANNPFLLKYKGQGKWN